MRDRTKSIRPIPSTESPKMIRANLNNDSKPDGGRTIIAATRISPMIASRSNALNTIQRGKDSATVGMILRFLSIIRKTTSPERRGKIMFIKLKTPIKPDSSNILPCTLKIHAKRCARNIGVIRSAAMASTKMSILTRPNARPICLKSARHNSQTNKLMPSTSMNHFQIARNHHMPLSAAQAFALSLGVRLIRVKILIAAVR